MLDTYKCFWTPGIGLTSLINHWPMRTSHWFKKNWGCSKLKIVSSLYRGFRTFMTLNHVRQKFSVFWQKESSDLLISQRSVGYHAGKPIDSVVYCCYKITWRFLWVYWHNKPSVFNQSERAYYHIFILERYINRWQTLGGSHPPSPRPLFYSVTWKQGRKFISNMASVLRLESTVRYG